MVAHFRAVSKFETANREDEDIKYTCADQPGWSFSRHCPHCSFSNIFPAPEAFQDLQRYPAQSRRTEVSTSKNTQSGIEKSQWR